MYTTKKPTCEDLTLPCGILYTTYMAIGNSEDIQRISCSYIVHESTGWVRVWAHSGDQFSDALVNKFPSRVIVQLMQCLPVTLIGVEPPSERMGFVVPDQVALKCGGIAFFEQLHRLLVHVATVPSTRRQDKSAVTATFQRLRGHALGDGASGG